MLMFSADAKTLRGCISLEWDNLSQTEITEDIDNVRGKIFDNGEILNKNKKEFKRQTKPFKRDVQYKEDYLFAESGGGELSDKIVVPFYYKKYIYAYGVIYKNDLKTCYYYNALGYLFTIENFEKNYGEFPVVSYQYKTNGVVAAVVYNISDVDQYMYNSDKAFIGRWFGEKYYNGNGKVVMTRTLPKN